MDTRTNQQRLVLSIVLNIAFIAAEVWAFITLFKDFGWSLIQQFGMLSNIVAVIASLVGLVFTVLALLKGDSFIPMTVKFVKYIAATAMALTFVMILFLLAPRAAFDGDSFFAYYAFPLFITNLICPVLSIVDFIFLSPSERLEGYHFIMTLLPAVIYMIVLFILNGIGTVQGPYYFLEIKSYPVIVNILMFIVVTVLDVTVAYILRKLEANYGPFVH